MKQGYKYHGGSMALRCAPCFLWIPEIWEGLHLRTPHYTGPRGLWKPGFRKGAVAGDPSGFWPWVSCPDSRVQLNAGRSYDVTEKEKTFLQYRVESLNNVVKT